MKFFLFRREEVNVGSVKSSDSGIGLSVFALPVDRFYDGGKRGCNNNLQ